MITPYLSLLTRTARRAVLVPMRAGMLSAFLAVGGALTLTGCFEISQSVVLNPDGSGKVTQSIITALGPDMLQGFGGLSPDTGAEGDAAAGPDADELADGFKMGFSSAIMEKSEGIEAWTEPQMEKLKDGRSKITVTGFFPDINKVRLSTEMNMSGGTDGPTGEPGEAAENDDSASSPPQPLLTVRKTDDGLMVIEFATPADAEKGAEKSTPPSDAPELTDAEVEAKIQEERQSWQFAKGFMAGILGGMKMENSVEVSGTIQSAVNVTKDSDSKATFTITGQQILAAMEKLLMDDELAAKAIREKGAITDSMDGLDGDPEMMKLLFEDGKPPAITVKPSAKPLFDYEAEVKKAKAAAEDAGGKATASAATGGAVVARAVR